MIVSLMVGHRRTTIQTNMASTCHPFYFVKNATYEKKTTCIYKYSQTSVHERLESRTIRFTNKFSEHKASRMTYCVCLELRTRKPSKRRQKQITLDNFLVRHRPSGSEAESSGAKRQKKEKVYPSKQ